ncbi:MAG: cobalt ECF transporter T component CbiQ [Thermodesulfobacteriota bacterium]
MKHAFLDHHSVVESPIHHLDARAKIIVFFTFILVAVSSPPTAFLLFGLLASVLIGIALSAKLPLAHLIKKVLVILPFLFVVALSIPFVKRDGGGEGSLWILWNVVIKSSLGVFSIILLSSTTSFPQLIKGMERLGSPKIFTVLASFLYRYSFILIDELQRMNRARDSRSFGGRWLWQLKVIGHMVGTLFLRSFHRGERVYQAMLSRGYNGTMPGTTGKSFGLREVLFLFLPLIFIFLRLYLR